MDYLCNETTVGSPVSGLAISEEYIVSFHHSTLCIYDHSFNLIFERYLYEKIIALRKLNDKEFIVLFRGNRAAQLTFQLETVALRILNGTAIDVLTIGGKTGGISKSLVLAWNNSEATVFSDTSKDHQVIRFGKLEIRNVEQVIFLQNYIPTLLIFWRSVAATQCTMVALDGVEIIEAFEVIDGIISAYSLGKYIIMLSRHFIQIRFKREMGVIELGLLAAPSNTSVIYRTVEHSVGEISLVSPQLLLLGDTFVLINGNGEIYRIVLDSDSTRITNISIVRGGKVLDVSCAASHGKLCVIGSLEGPSMLCRLRQGEGKVCSPEATSNRNPLLCLPSFLGLVSIRNNTGIATSFSHQGDGSLLLTTKHKMFATLPMINFQVHDRVKLPFHVNRLFIKADGIYGEGAQESVRIIKSTMNCSPYTILMDDGVLSIYENESFNRRIYNVDCWNQDNDILVYTIGNALVLYSLSDKKRLFYSSGICKFEDKIRNEAFSTSANLIEIIENDHEGSTREKIDLTAKSEPSENVYPGDEKIIEILVKNETHPFIFVRTAKHLFIYKKVGNALHKVFIPRYLSFDTRKSMFCMGKYVYLRSRTPYMVFIDGAIYMHASKCRFAMGIADENTFYFVYKGYLIRSKLPGLENGTEYFSNYILQGLTASSETETKKPILPIENTVADSDSETEQVKRRKANDCDEQHGSPFIENSELKRQHRFDDDIIIKDNSSKDSCPRRIAYSKNYIAVASAQFAPFTYVPFIPMVYTSQGPGLAPISEPINKEQETFSGPLVQGRTLKYRIELRSRGSALYHAVELGENELVCDLQILLDDVVVVCTSFPEGEEKAVRGRIIVYAVRDIVPDPEFPWRDKQLSLIVSESVKSPCLAVTDVRGLLAVGVGTRLMIYDVDTTTGTTAAHRNTGLSAVGRNEIALLTIGIVSIENLIAVVDRHRGIRLFFLRPKDPLRLHLLSQGDPIPCASQIQYIVYPSNQYDLLSFVVRDVFGTLHIYTYSPQYPLSCNGTRLIKRAEVRTGISGQFTDSKTVPTTSHAYSAVFLADSILFSVSAIGPSHVLLLQAAIAAHIIVPGGIDARNYLEPSGYVNMECREVASSRLLLHFFFLDVETQKQVLQMANLSWNEAISIYNMIYS